jgi:hypothetical protein
MDAICLLVAGALVATLPEDQFEIEWRHTVQKTRWSETYRAEGPALRLVSARVEGSGAGMEPGPDAHRDGAGWRWYPQRLLSGVTLALSRYGDYRMCTARGCRSLSELGALPPEGELTIRSCVGSRSAP